MSVTHPTHRVGTVDAVTSDRHEMSAISHHVTQHCIVPIVHVVAVELNDLQVGLGLRVRVKG